MSRGFQCQFDYSVSFKASKKGISWKQTGLRLLTKTNKQTNKQTNKRKELKGGATPPENLSYKHTTLVGFGPGRCWGRTESITNSAGLLTKSLHLFSSYHFFGWKYIGWLEQSENTSPGINWKFLRRSYICMPVQHVSQVSTSKFSHNMTMRKLTPWYLNEKMIGHSL